MENAAADMGRHSSAEPRRVGQDIGRTHGAARVPAAGILVLVVGLGLTTAACMDDAPRVTRTPGDAGTGAATRGTTAPGTNGPGDPATERSQVTPTVAPPVGARATTETGSPAPADKVATLDLDRATRALETVEAAAVAVVRQAASARAEAAMGPFFAAVTEARAALGVDSVRGGAPRDGLLQLQPRVDALFGAMATAQSQLPDTDFTALEAALRAFADAVGAQPPALAPEQGG